MSHPASRRQAPRLAAMGGAVDGRPRRAPRTHVYIVDGTLSSLDTGRRTHAGRLFDLLREHPTARQTVAYHPGVQGAGWRKWWSAATGEGLNDAIRKGYVALSNRYRPGDKIMLFGYSRGAYAVRSLAGMIGRVGLLRAACATERKVTKAFRHYEGETPLAKLEAFKTVHCHSNVEIEMIGAFDTVKALGLPYPILSRLAPMATAFHDHHLGAHVRAGYHALALDETRTAFRPVFWERAEGWDGRLEQMWFPGAHGDVGGQIDGNEAARGLANQSMLWMLERAEAHGLTLPADWRARFPALAGGAMVGDAAGAARCFLFRAPRPYARGNGHALHHSLAARRSIIPGYRPKARAAHKVWAPIAALRKALAPRARAQIAASQIASARVVAAE